MRAVKKAIRTLGITPQHRGYEYLALAIELRLNGARRGIYQAVAEQFGTTWKSVERNVRFAISKAWERDRGPFELIAGRRLEKCPNNMLIICLVAELVEEVIV